MTADLDFIELSRNVTEFMQDMKSGLSAAEHYVQVQQQQQQQQQKSGISPQFILQQQQLKLSPNHTITGKLNIIFFFK